MGAGQSDLYKNTWGDNPDNIPDELKDKIKLPENDAQLKHIFRKETGHLDDTPENREMIVELANDESYHCGKDMYGKDWHVRINSDGSQDWVSHFNQTISDAGRNDTPRQWDGQTGLNYNPYAKDGTENE